MHEEHRMIVHHAKECVSCGMCVSVCIRRNFEFEDGLVRLRGDAGDNCLGCGHCLAVCPEEGALSLTEYGHDKPEPRADLPDDDAVLHLIRSRRSIRFYQDAGPSRVQIAKLLEAGRYAPTGHNSQDFGFVVVYGRERVRALGECALKFYRRLIRLSDNPFGRWIIRLAAGRGTFETFMKMAPRLKRHLAIFDETGRIDMVWDAPCLVFVYGPDKPDSAVNAILAGHTVMIQAHAMGLGTCILGLLKAGLDHAGRGVKRSGVEIPAGHKLHLIMSLGVPRADIKFHKIPPRREPRVQFLGDIP